MYHPNRVVHFVYAIILYFLLKKYKTYVKLKSNKSNYIKRALLCSCIFSHTCSLNAPIYNNLRTIRFVGCFFIYGYQIEKGINLDNLTEEEVKNLKRQTAILNLGQENNWSQIATSSKNENSKHRGKKYVPYVFTEQGIAMLSGLLKNDIAVQVSINIMNAFVEMRKFLMLNGQVFERLTNVEYQLQEHNKKFDEVFNQLQLEENIKQRVFFDGQIYDAFLSLKKIANLCKLCYNMLYPLYFTQQRQRKKIFFWRLLCIASRYF